MIRSIRLFHRRINFNSTTSERCKCVASLQHSLRLTNKGTKLLEWDESQSSKNLIWVSGDTYPMDKFLPKHKQKLLNLIAPKPKVKNKREHQNNRRKYRYKIKSAIATDRKNGKHESADFMESILKKSDTTHDLYDMLDEAKNIAMPRKKQRMNMLKTFIKAHFKIANAKPENNVYIQEGIIAIPHQWNVGEDIIPLKGFINYAQQFLTEFFPEYKINTIVGHADEKLNNESTGAHIHYFLSGINSTTQKMDLHRTQIKVVNEYIRQSGNTDDLLPHDAKLNHFQSRIFGEYFQRMLYQHINLHLFNQNGLNATFASETEKKSEKRKQMNRESKLPKSQRENNRLNRQIEQLKQEELSLVEKTKSLKASNDSLEATQEHLIQDINELTQLSSTLNEENSQVKAYNDSLETKQELLIQNINELTQVSSTLNEENSQVKAYNDSLETKQELLIQNINELTQVSSTLNEENTQMIIVACRDVYLFTLAKQKTNDVTKKQYLEKLFKSFNKLPTQMSQDIVNEFSKQMIGYSIERRNEKSLLNE